MRPTPRPFAALLALVIAVLVAACGDDKPAPAVTAAAAQSGTTAGSSGTTASAEPSGTTDPASTDGANTAATEEGGQGAASGSDAPSGETTDAGADEGEALEIPTGPDGCSHVEPPTAGGDRRSYDAPPPSGLPDGAPGTVRFETSCGPIAIELDREVGGAVAEAFAGLVRDGFYDGLPFHRVVPDFVLQGGDPEGTGGGGPGFEVTQAPPASYVYAKGDVAMAKLPSDPAGTAGSQFFIVASPQGASALGQPGEQPLYAVVGHVLDETSLQTVARISALGVGDAPPVEPVWIWRANLEG
jgi:cyclophilin family peptidyl-prolyl cis-trans isomerase